MCMTEVIWLYDIAIGDGKLWPQSCRNQSFADGVPTVELDLIQPGLPERFTKVQLQCSMPNTTRSNIPKILSQCSSKAKLLWTAGGWLWTHGALGIRDLHLGNLRRVPRLMGWTTQRGHQWEIYCRCFCWSLWLVKHKGSCSLVKRNSIRLVHGKWV